MHFSSHHRSSSEKGFLLLLFISLLSLSTAAPLDTVLIGNGGPGPYSIGTVFADSASIGISFTDSTPVPPWVYIQILNAFLFSEPIDSGRAIHVSCNTTYYGVPKLSSRYVKTLLRETDSTAVFDSINSSFSAAREENLAVSGYKSIGVSMGSLGQVNLEQGLDVRIGGDIRPQTTLSAHLSDQGSSLDGATREISDFDMIYIGLDDPRYRVVAGDQYVAWPFKGILSGQKKIKGLSGGYGKKTDGRLSLSAFGALSGGEFTVETKQGKTGVQGPYYLIGKGDGREFVQPLSGTVKIRLNGRELTEGALNDFVVDYEMGTVLFTPRNLIRDEDLIRIEYEFRQFYYQRSLLGASTALAGPDSLFSASGVVWSESDNKNHPIDLTLGREEIAALEQAGDAAPYSSTARPVHPNDVAGESQFYPLYKKRVAADGTLFFVYDPYNAKNPDSVQGLYYVWFRKAGPSEKGNYRLSFTDQRGPVYEFAGRDAGSYTDQSALPVPARRTSGEMRLQLRRSLFGATLNIAGQDQDRNLFSPLDEQDNRASATNFSFLAGKQSVEEPSAYIAGSHRFTSARFDAEVLSAFDRREEWDDVSLALRRTEQQVWETKGGATIIPRLSTDLSYGQVRDAGDLITDRWSPGVAFSPWDDRLSLVYSGGFFRHTARENPGSGRRESATAALSFPRHTGRLFYRDEWRADSTGQGRGLYETGIAYDFLPLSLHQQLSFLSRGKADRSAFIERDTGYSVRFEQSLDHRFTPSWRLAGTGHFDRSESYGADRTTTLLIDLLSDLDKGGKGLSSRQHYRTSAENASSFVQVPLFAGKGLGTHAYDSVRREFVPFVGGDYFLQQREVYDQGSDRRIKKTALDIAWSWRPGRTLAGILNDLAWQGALVCEEHVAADDLGLSTWAPGYRSLSSFFQDGSSNSGAIPVSYADLSYRQDVDWIKTSADSTVNAQARGSVTPGFRRIRNYTEGSLESAVDFKVSRQRLTLGGSLHLLSVDHKDTAAGAFPAQGLDYSLLDRRLELSQEYRLLKQLSVSLLEVFGLGQKFLASVREPVVFDSSFYYQVAPSFSWQPGGSGHVAGSYTYSVVPLPGELDYRMARGFGSGTIHRAMISADIKIGERLLLIGSYRGDSRKAAGAGVFEPANHVFSLEVRAFM